MLLRSVIVLSSMVLLSSCGNVNTESQLFYKNKIPFRHGIIPRPNQIDHGKPKVQPLNALAVKRGKGVYQDNCLNCHGPKADGNGPMAEDLVVRPKNLVKLAKKVPNFKFYMMISQWQGQMPGWRSALTKSELADVEQFIRSLAE